MADTPFWTQDPAAAARGLGCGTEGLTSADAAARLTRYGRNADAVRREAGPLAALTRRLLEPLALMLIAASIVSAATGDAVSAGIILAMLVLSVVLDTIQE